MGQLLQAYDKTPPREGSEVPLPLTPPVETKQVHLLCPQGTAQTHKQWLMSFTLLTHSSFALDNIFL